jgi:uncharacterized membrane protein YoaK (UPF0700 family)
LPAGLLDQGTDLDQQFVGFLALRDSSLAGGANPRWRIRVAAISMMFLGAASGALILHHSLTSLLALSALLVTGCAVLQLYREETSHEAKLKVH